MKTKEKMLIAASAVIALTIPALVSLVVAQPKRYSIPSGSMKPTLAIGSTIKVQRRAYANLAAVQRGDIIVYARRDPATGTTIETVQRVVGLPNDKVKISGTALFINGRALPHALLRRAGRVAVYRESNGAAKYSVQYGDNVPLPAAEDMAPTPPFSVTVPAGRLFCLGDNRDNSYDSRFSGAVPFASVVGKRVP